jgi:predicted alpha/beta hydrolase
MVSRILRMRVARRQLILFAVAVVPVAYWSFSTSAEADPPRAINLTGRIPETVFLNPKAVPKRSVKEWRKFIRSGQFAHGSPTKRVRQRR